MLKEVNQQQDRQMIGSGHFNKTNYVGRTLAVGALIMRPDRVGLHGAVSSRMVGIRIFGEEKF